jgi:hypothetical protein
MTSDDASVRSDFGFDYFDDMQATGYRGYRKDGNGDDNYLPWTAGREFCAQNNIASANDWGCAKGYLVEELIAAGVDAVGYDVSEYAVEIARENGLPCEVLGYEGAADGRGREVDANFSLGSLMYVDEDEIPAVLAGLRRLTRRYLLASIFYEGTRQDLPDVWRRTTRPKEWWREQLTNAGFAFERDEPMFEVYSVT